MSSCFDLVYSVNGLIMTVAILETIVIVWCMGLWLKHRRKV